MAHDEILARAAAAAPEVAGAEQREQEQEAYARGVRARAALRARAQCGQGCESNSECKEDRCPVCHRTDAICVPKDGKKNVFKDVIGVGHPDSKKKKKSGLKKLLGLRQASEADADEDENEDESEGGASARDA